MLSVRRAYYVLLYLLAAVVVSCMTGGYRFVDWADDTAFKMGNSTPSWLNSTQHARDELFAD